MKIGELAVRSGLARSRIRFYEAGGLIEVQRRSNGYREYEPAMLHRLGIIIAAQRAGFTLDEIRSLLPAANTGRWNRKTLLAKLRSKVEQIAMLQKQLRDNKSHLLAVIEQIESGAELPCDESRARVMSAVQRASGRLGS